MHRSSGLATHIVEHLGRSVVRGSLGPSDVLPTEQELCVQFGVSRTVVREAMKTLSTKGLLESRPKRGARVHERRNWTPLDLDILNWSEKNERFYRDLTELRRMVEIPAAEMAATRATKDNIRAMEQAISEMGEAEAAGRSGQFKEADMKLHQEVGRACHNQLIEQLFSIITPLIRISLDTNVHLLGVAVAGTVQLHRNLVEGIQHRNPAEARTAITRIIEQSWLDMHSRGSRKPASSSRKRR